MLPLAIPQPAWGPTRWVSRHQILLKKGPQCLDGRLIKSGKISTECRVGRQVLSAKERHEDLVKRHKTLIKIF
jgi:hypothetical protein